MLSTWVSSWSLAHFRRLVICFVIMKKHVLILMHLLLALTLPEALCLAWSVTSLPSVVLFVVVFLFLFILKIMWAYSFLCLLGQAADTNLPFQMGFLVIDQGWLLLRATVALDLRRHRELTTCTFPSSICCWTYCKWESAFQVAEEASAVKDFDPSSVIEVTIVHGTLSEILFLFLFAVVTLSF